ncbi:hypothetical protein XU18_1593 [Perkinsela sp. CCAP 1560/4]|nr:hypothetical protein XU18_1593 [Perkinsela sp. CCAP 1560/4]|eukprot:KNH07783.1 hypothetical protein XU18_1593 [Perkinsela sp. CCAP 1560/4]
MDSFRSYFQKTWKPQYKEALLFASRTFAHWQFQELKAWVCSRRSIFWFLPRRLRFCTFCKYSEFLVSNLWRLLTPMTRPQIFRAETECQSALFISSPLSSFSYQVQNLLHHNILYRMKLTVYVTFLVQSGEDAVF